MRTMIELEKFFDCIRNSGTGSASSTLFQRSDGRRLMMTLTDELFLPARIVYRVKDREELLSRFQNLRCMMFDPFRLVGCGSTNLKPRVSVFRSSTDWLRASVNRWSWVPVKDESRICFNDIEPIADDSARLAAELSAIPERTLEPLERHRLTAFYEDGEEHMKGAMRMRELMATPQYFSDTPIKPYQLIRELLQSFDKTDAPPHKKSQSAPAAPASVIPQACGAAKAGRNDSCPCGSGMKFKKCRGA
jgi:hypothetical protein